jgi:hypothetical protein
MALLKPYTLRKHPILAGMLWAVLFVPAFLLLMWVMGQPIHGLRGIVVLILLALVGGFFWGLTMKAFVAAQGDRP